MAKILPKEGLAGMALRGVEDMFKGPEVPEPAVPDAPVSKGEEGIRTGEMLRQSKRRALGQAYITKGQARATQPLAPSGQL